MLKSLKAFFQKKSEGLVGVATTIILWIFLIFIAVFVFMVGAYNSVASSVRNALSDTNLAVSTISFVDFGNNQSIHVCGKSYIMKKFLPQHEYTDEVFAQYKDAIAVNLELENNGVTLSRDDFLYGGTITIEYFTIYNYYEEDNSYDVITYNSSGLVSIDHLYGPLTAPNGQSVHGTSVYSQISFPVKGYFAVFTGDFNTYGQGAVAHIGQLSGITI